MRRADQVSMRSPLVRTLIAVLAASALIAAPAVAADDPPAEPDVTLAQEAADEAAEAAEEAADSAPGSVADVVDPTSDPCNDAATPDGDDGPPVAPEDDPCADASASDTRAGAGTATAGSRAGSARGATKRLSLSIPLLLKRGYATVGAVKPSAAGVVVQELTVAAHGKAKARRIARVRRVVKRSGRVTLHVAISKPGRKVLRGARTTLKATLRTTITLRSGRSTTTRRAVLLVPGRRR